MTTRYLSPGTYRINGMRIVLQGRATCYVDGETIETEADYQRDNRERLEQEEELRDYELTKNDLWVPGVA